MKELITRLHAGESLDTAAVREAAAGLLDESLEIQTKKEFLRALAAKGETPAEIATLASVFLERARDPQLTPEEVGKPMLDVCGTGGDKLHMFNVSTTATFLLAAAGIAVVKHGNRGITSKSGGADVLEALGVRIDLEPAEFRESVLRTGMGFLFAPLYHPAFKAVAPVRKELAEEGTRTVFNILGPLLNPVRPDYQVVGVFSPALPPVFAEILNQLGRKRAWAVNGDAGDGRSMDELSTLGPNLIVETRDGTVAPPTTLDPADLGLAKPELSELQGGEAAENASTLIAILDGSERGARREIVLLNVAAGLVVTGMAPSMSDGLAQAAELIESGQALAKLREVQQFS